MLKLDLDNHQFESLKSTELRAENILERHDLQKTIKRSWELFKNEIGLPSAYLIGEEVRPHESIQDSIDLLAFDPDDSSLIVIELKRDRSKLQLLQALSYAAMVSKWDSDRLVQGIQNDINPKPDELIDLIKSNELNSDIKVILISETYDPEVIITADWLSQNYSLNITAFSLSLQKLGKSAFLSVDQRYPLKELTDVYEMRSKRKSTAPGKEIQWTDVLPKLRYPFAKKAIELCQKIRVGDPSRRRFLHIRTHYDGFVWITINLREKYINVYLKGIFENSQKLIRSKFRSEIVINTWRDGLSFLVKNSSQFDDLIKWLKL